MNQNRLLFSIVASFLFCEHFSLGTVKGALRFHICVSCLIDSMKEQENNYKIHIEIHY